MESAGNNHALAILKLLRARAGPDGEVHLDMQEVCRAGCLDEDDVRDCLTDLEQARFITTEIICYVAEEWR